VNTVAAQHRLGAVALAVSCDHVPCGARLKPARYPRIVALDFLIEKTALVPRPVYQNRSPS